MKDRLEEKVSYTENNVLRRRGKNRENINDREKEGGRRKMYEIKTKNKERKGGINGKRDN